MSKAERIRLLMSERCSVAEVASYLKCTRDYVRIVQEKARTGLSYRDLFRRRTEKNARERGRVRIAVAFNNWEARI